MGGVSYAGSQHTTCQNTYLGSHSHSLQGDTLLNLHLGSHVHCLPQDHTSQTLHLFSHIHSLQVTSS